jgi:hypothetical protein
MQVEAPVARPDTVRRRGRTALFPKKAPKRCSIAARLPAFHKSGAKPALKPGGLNVRRLVRELASVTRTPWLDQFHSLYVDVVVVSPDCLGCHLPASES